MKRVSKIIQRGVILLALLMVAAFSAWAGIHAQEEQPEYIGETGFSVTGKFHEKYYSVDNPQIVFGFPITDQITTKDDLVVQYFNKARFEQGPDGEISLTPLGREFLRLNGPPAETNTNSGSCKRFAGSDFPVCFEFLNYFEQFGGVKQFGLPISNYGSVGDWLVQYFEYGVLEYKLNASNNPTVSIAWLGDRYFIEMGENPSYLIPTPPPNAIADGILGLDVHAFIDRDAAAGGYKPTLYVIVKDQKRLSVPNASVDILVRYPDGHEARNIIEPTNNHGFSRYELTVTEQLPGMVEVFVTVTYRDLNQDTRTSFRIWY
jgi:hypothetical protein